MARTKKLTNFQKTTEFNMVLGQGVSENPKIPTLAQCQLRLQLINEEALVEMNKAMDDRNLVELADAIGDALVVVYGAANDAGLDADKIFDVIHGSNMSKLCKSEEDAQKSVEMYKEGNGFHGKYEPINASYRESSEQKGKFIVYNLDTGKTLKGVDYYSPEDKLFSLIYPNGKPELKHQSAIDDAKKKVEEGSMSGTELWLLEESLEKLG